MFPVHPEYIQVRTAEGVVHVFERHLIVRVEVQGFPGLLQRRNVPYRTFLDVSQVYVEGVRVVVATFASGFVELRGATAVDFLRQFYAFVYFREPPQEDDPAEEEESA